MAVGVAALENGGGLQGGERADFGLVYHPHSKQEGNGQDWRVLRFEPCGSRQVGCSHGCEGRAERGREGIWTNGGRIMWKATLTLLMFPVLFMCAEVYRYAQWSGERPIGRYERLCYERHERDLANAGERGLWFDDYEARRRCDAFPTFLKHFEGEWAGRPFELMPWERFVISNLYGWKRLPEGMTVKQAERIAGKAEESDREKVLLNAGVLRRFSRGLIEVPKKSGKSPLMGGIALLSLVMDNEPGSQVRSVATKRDQAKIVFDASRKMLSFSSQLKPFVKSFQTALVVDQTNSNFKPLSAEAGGEDGMNPHLAIIDELHRHANPDLVQLLMMSFGARRQPLLLAITTAGGEGKSVWREWHEDGEKILEQVEQSDKFFVFMAGADADDDWTLTETHRKANPSYGITIKPESIREECDAAIRMPRLRPDFMRFRLNLPINLAERWIDMDAWNAGLSEFDETTLAGRPCYIGLDLSRTTDLTARAALFPPLNGDPNWYVLSKAWIPADKIEQRSKRDRVPFSEWYRAGQVIATPGNVVDYAFIQADVEALAKHFDVLEIAYDPWNATKFATDLQNAGHDNLVEVRQGTRSLSPAMKEIERLVLQGRFRHNGDPVLSWCMANVVARADANENIAPDKTTSKERIDAAVALITAMSRAAVQEDALNPYDERGLLSV